MEELKERAQDVAADALVAYWEMFEPETGLDDPAPLQAAARVIAEALARERAEGRAQGRNEALDEAVSAVNGYLGASYRALDTIAARIENLKAPETPNA